MNAVDPPRYAVIGHPVAHSRSPRIHELFSQQTGVRLRYERLPAPPGGFAATVRAFFDAGGFGLNVTVPFKQEACLLARQLSLRARLAGAVNTLWQDHGVLHGCNTDGVGLTADLRRLGVRLAGARILLVGAGGAARGVLQPLIEAGCARLRVVNRTASRVEKLAEDWQRSGGQAIETGTLAEATLAGGWNVVVNATASSLDDLVPVLPGALYADGALAYDMVYAARPTPFMRQAAADGATVVSDGLGMLVAQAAESFRLWHDVMPEVAPVLATLRAELLEVCA